MFIIAIDSPKSLLNGKKCNVFTSDAISVVVKYYRDAIRVKKRILGHNSFVVDSGVKKHTF